MWNALKGREKSHLTTSHVNKLASLAFRSLSGYFLFTLLSLAFPFPSESPERQRKSVQLRIWDRRGSGTSGLTSNCNGGTPGGSHPSQPWKGAREGEPRAAGIRQPARRVGLRGPSRPRRAIARPPGSRQARPARGQGPGRASDALARAARRKLRRGRGGRPSSRTHGRVRGERAVGVGVTGGGRGGQLPGRTRGWCWSGWPRRGASQPGEPGQEEDEGKQRPPAGRLRQPPRYGGRLRRRRCPPPCAHTGLRARAGCSPGPWGCPLGRWGDLCFALRGRGAMLCPGAAARAAAAAWCEGCWAGTQRRRRREEEWGEEEEERARPRQRREARKLGVEAAAGVSAQQRVATAAPQLGWPLRPL